MVKTSSRYQKEYTRQKLFPEIRTFLRIIKKEEFEDLINLMNFSFGFKKAEDKFEHILPKYYFKDDGIRLLKDKIDYLEEDYNLILSNSALKKSLINIQGRHIEMPPFYHTFSSSKGSRTKGRNSAIHAPKLL